MPPRRSPLTAAATVLPLKNPVNAKKAFGRREPWQAEAWDYFDLVPELKQATWFLGNMMAKLKLFIAQVPEGTEDPQPADAEGSKLDPAVVAQAKLELSRLRGALGGQGAILREANMNLEISGEGFLIGWGERPEVKDPVSGEITTAGQPENWEIRSIDEVSITGSGKSTKYTVKDDKADTKGRQLDPELDTCIRLYQQHPRYSSLADCAMRGVLTECQLLVMLSQQLVSETASHASAGFLTIANELGFPAPQPAEEGGSQPPDELLKAITEMLVDPVEDPTSPYATVPGLLRGPAEYLKPDVLRHVTFDRKASDSIEARIDQRVKRLARGLNLPVEKVLGHQETTYANAEQVDQDQFDDHLEPRCVLMVDALTIGFLRAQLRADDSPVKNHPDVDKVMVWYDASACIRQPDKAANALDDLKAGIIGEAAARGARGWGDDDAPTDEERLQRAGLTRGILTADLTLALLRLLGIDGQNLEVVPIPAAQAQPVGPDGELLPTVPADGAAAMALAATAGRRSSNGLGRRLMEIDRDLRTRLLVASDAQLVQALDRAGARIRSKAGKHRDLIATMRNRDLAARLGRQAVGALALEAEDLLDGSFDALEEQFMAWGASAQAEALDAVAQIVSGFTSAERAALKLRQAADLTEAWGWLKTHLRTFAHDQLFDPAPEAVAGELVDALSVPAGMLRQAIAIAGGAILETTGVGGDAWTAVDSSGMPPGGIGTGELLAGALRDHGAGTEAYVWVYGPAVRARPFEPHAELDGVEFSNFDDDVLANTSGFPDVSHYMPGDHGGCICDFEPIITLPEEA